MCNLSKNACGGVGNGKRLEAGEMKLVLASGLEGVIGLGECLLN